MSVEAFDAFYGIVGEGEGRASLLSDFLAFGEEIVFREELGGSDDAEVHACKGCACHESVRHIGLSVSDVSEGEFIQRFIEMFLQCQEIGEGLCGWS